MTAITINTSHEGCEFDGHPDGAHMPGVIPVHRAARSACCSAVLAEGGNDADGYTCTACGKPTEKVLGDRKAHWTCRCGTRRSQVVTEPVDEPAEG